MKFTNTLRQYISDADEASPRLPYTHNTRLANLRALSQSSGLSPTLCDVFDEELLYLFYGRPSYRVNPKVEPVYTNIKHLPVCFIIKPTAEIAIRRIFPFDSQAHELGLFESVLGSDSNISSFELDNNDTIPSKVVNAFYENNESYYDFSPRSRDDHEISVLAFETVEYCDLLVQTGITASDDRKGAIEIQTDREILFNTGDVEAIVLPDKAYDDDYVRYFVDEVLDAVALPYPFTKASRPIEFHGVISDYVRKYFKARGYFG